VVDKTCESAERALDGLRDGATVLVGGFGGSGVPVGLLTALGESGARDLTIVTNNAGTGNPMLSELFGNDQVARLICSYPRSTESAGSTDPKWFEKRYLEGTVELELVPQGTLSERIRAAGAGIAAFYTRTGVGTIFAEGKESRMVDGEEWLLEYAIHGDVALVRADQADHWGNLTYRKAARNFGPTMLAAAATGIVEATSILPVGHLDPELIVTPGIYVDKVVRSADAY
jgi:3-oxoadipate CoA-transferase alpha subunit